MTKSKKNDSPQITVIMTVYEGDNDKFFEMALDSVLAQSYNNFELLLIVDGYISANKERIIDRVCSLDNVSVVHLEKNIGPAGARNVGIDLANGYYIAIMDSDDICAENRLEKQKIYLESGSFDVISSPLFVIDENNNVVGEKLLPSDSLSVRKMAPYSCPLNNPAIFGNAKVLKENKYNESLRVSEDYDLWIRLIKKGYKLGNTKEKTVYYRQPKYSLKKRRGFAYAYADFIVKMKASELVSWYMKPTVYITAIITALVRISPEKFFIWIYRRNLKSYFIR